MATIVPFDMSADTFSAPATAYLHQGKHDRAIRDYDRAIELKPRRRLGLQQPGGFLLL